MAQKSNNFIKETPTKEVPAEKQEENPRHNGRYRKLKINKSVHGYRAGSILPIMISPKTGLPIDPYWRRRLADAKIDNCVEWV